jgi:hypothetical protein
MQKRTLVNGFAQRLLHGTLIVWVDHCDKVWELQVCCPAAQPKDGGQLGGYVHPIGGQIQIPMAHFGKAEGLGQLDFVAPTGLLRQTLFGYILPCAPHLDKPGLACLILFHLRLTPGLNNAHIAPSGDYSVVIVEGISGFQRLGNHLLD